MMRWVESLECQDEYAKSVLSVAEHGTPAPFLFRGLSVRDRALLDRVETSFGERCTPDQVKMVHRSIVTAENYWISRDMFTLVNHAAQSMPDQILLRTDPISERGFLTFESPPVHQVAGVIESVNWIEEAGHIVCVHDFRQLGRMALDGNTAAIEALARGEDYGFTMTFGDVVHPSNVGGLITPAFMKAFWAISQQTLCAVTEQRDRAASRRLDKARSDIEARTVKVITLRRRHHASEGDGASEDVEWTHRWIVAGHWRNQWLPSVGTHRLQWISSYIKGPEDKPLALKRTVHKVTR